MRIGILFGGQSREREVSFAGGRTVYDNLNKELFEAVPLFVDSFNNIILLNWEFVYKGSIRDFYPPVSALPPTQLDFQYYAENLGDLTSQQQEKLIVGIGRKVQPHELCELIDFAFLALHGTYGEDGTIQGLLEWYGIPYSGSGILPSGIGINKRVQKEWQQAGGYPCPKFLHISRSNWLAGDRKEIFANVVEAMPLPYVMKPANQGSSIGVSIFRTNDFDAFAKAINRCFFIEHLYKSEWVILSDEARQTLLLQVSDIREGIGLPALVNGTKVFDADGLLKAVTLAFSSHDMVTIEGVYGESEVLMEEFIDGREFSCIVIQNTGGEPVALPPTEIVKGNEVFDYRSKYLPGLSRKITPILLPDADVERIRTECVRLFNFFHFNVYARIDGFIKDDGTIYLNDPNTTSGMMPSSFFFHQAAEIGLNPSQFLTYIIIASLRARASTWQHNLKVRRLLKQLNGALEKQRNIQQRLIRIAVIMGGYSSERHISVESGRNVYEKLSASTKYLPVPVFLTGNDEHHELYLLPVNSMLKDNADDIKEKVKHFHRNPVLQRIIDECSDVIDIFSSVSKPIFEPKKISFAELAEKADGVFIALHGRPGEDGSLQAELEKIGLPYNGSGTASSQITINKFETSRILREHGFLVATGLMVYEKEYGINAAKVIDAIEQLGYPVIAKPSDDGCSSAVKKITNRVELIAYMHTIFRQTEEIGKEEGKILRLMPKEEFPRKNYFLIEKFIQRENAKHFLEITGGFVTRLGKNGEVQYEMFEPSEVLAQNDILSLEEKFLAGQGQNITPARYARTTEENKRISLIVQEQLKKAATVLGVEGYARIDAFVRINCDDSVEVIFIEVNSLPGMTPATCIFHQCALNGYKPFEFIDAILEYGFKRKGK
jgi:D-alanine-D-alanine ligase